ncbi:MAG: nitronate monooxygenase [Demequinaceae bacterium]|nr:nitronate monooxygenase [Demequinaceae bacterium]
MGAVLTPDGLHRRILPRIIQGGMGVAVSSWRLASEVARRGQLGVVSGTGLDLVLARRLQDGDRGGAIRRALAAFPVSAITTRILDKYFLPNGRKAGEGYSTVPRLSVTPRRLAQELLMVGNFVEVWLAKEGHDGEVGVNYLEKGQMATPAAAYGAMLAGVDYVLMGAGIPRDIPHLLDELAEHRKIAFPVDVAGAESGTVTVDLDPPTLLGATLARLKRPFFVAIISAHILAMHLSKDSHTRPDGFVIEGPRAGGHNAPPRGKLVFDESGEPVFGPRDDADVAQVAACGLPFWLAGAVGTPEGLVAAEEQGAQGIQAGTLFALSHESGLDNALKERAIAGVRDGTLTVRTMPRVSPTGFPFKVAQIPGTLMDEAAIAHRSRRCDMSLLRTPFVGPDGDIAYRCPAEPIEDFVGKGGAAEETVGRACLCNALFANVGLGQTQRDGYQEEPLVTLGEDFEGARRLAEQFPQGWSAHQALDWLLGRLPTAEPSLA